MATAKDAVSATMMYCSETTEPSLYRNGKLGVRRDAEGTDHSLGKKDPQSKFMGEARHRVELQDARKADPPMSLHTNGFEMQPRPSLPIDYYSWEDTVHKYYADCETAVREATGARWAFAFDHNVRSLGRSKKQDRQAGGSVAGQGLVQQPARIVHGDYTLRSAGERMSQLAKPASKNDTLRDVLKGAPLLPPEVVAAAAAPGGRWGIINVWRNIAATPVQAYPLALTDGKTVHRNELVTFEIHYADRVGENYFAKHSPKHEWYVYPELTRDEVLLLKTWDSAGTLARSGGTVSDCDGAPRAPCTFSFHSAADTPPPPGCPDRESMEVRCFVVWGPSTECKL